MCCDVSSAALRVLGVEQEKADTDASPFIIFSSQSLIWLQIVQWCM